MTNADGHTNFRIKSTGEVYNEEELPNRLFDIFSDEDFIAEASEHGFYDYSREEFEEFASDDREHFEDLKWEYVLGVVMNLCNGYPEVFEQFGIEEVSE